MHFFVCILQKLEALCEIGCSLPPINFSKSSMSKMAATGSLLRYRALCYTVGTVLNSNTMMGAVSQACLPLSAAHLIIVDWTTASTDEGLSKKAVPTVKLQE